MYLIQLARRLEKWVYSVGFYDPSGEWIEINSSPYEHDALRISAMYNRSLKGDY